LFAIVLLLLVVSLLHARRKKKRDQTPQPMTTAEVPTHPAAKELSAQGRIVELSSRHLPPELPAAQAIFTPRSSKWDMVGNGSESLRIIAALPEKEDRFYLITPA
jgi:hypothetical protein